MGEPLRTIKQYVNIDDLTNEFGGIMEDLASRIAGQIVATAKPGSRPTTDQIRRILRASRLLTTNVLAGGSRVGIFGANNVNPRTPFAALLNVYLANAVLDSVTVQSSYIQKVAPPDVRAFLLGGKPPDYPPPRYDPPHVWVDPQGYRLSDRLWRTDQVTRDKIDAMLNAELKDGEVMGSYRMALRLRQFLWPKEDKVKTDKPYGRTISFSAMRLARTEITRAFSETTFIAAEFNPWVDGMDWGLSAQHPKPDICNKLATIGMHGERLRSPYDKRNAPMCVRESHPQCICTNRPVVTANDDEIVADIRDSMKRGQPAPFTPADPIKFSTWLIGADLLNFSDRIKKIADGKGILALR